MFEVGRLCLKLAGREAGKYCVVIKKMDENFVMVTGPRELTSVKRRRCNMNHLEPLMEVVKIKSDASDNDVLKAYQQANLMKKLDLAPGKAVPKPAAKEAVKAPEKKEPRKGLLPSLRRKAEEPPKPPEKKDTPIPEKAVKHPKGHKKSVKKAPAKKAPAKKPVTKTAKKAKPAPKKAPAKKVAKKKK